VDNFTPSKSKSVEHLQRYSVSGCQKSYWVQERIKERGMDFSKHLESHRRTQTAKTETQSTAERRAKRQLNKIWRNKHINLTKLRQYVALILSTLLYYAEVWPLTVTLSKKLEAGHHRWLRGILGVTWSDKVTNEEVRNRTGQILLPLQKNCPVKIGPQNAGFSAI